VMQMLMFPMVFLSGVFFPLDGLPSWMGTLVKLNPVTYGVAPIRQVVLTETAGQTFSISVFGHTMSILENVGVMAVFGTTMILLAMWSFGNQE